MRMPYGCSGCRGISKKKKKSEREQDIDLSLFCIDIPTSSLLPITSLGSPFGRAVSFAA